MRSSSARTWFSIFKWVNNDNPEETVIVPWILVGRQGDSAQSFGAALTYAYRYFLLKYFGVATPDDDPDSWLAKQRASEMGEDRQLAASIIATVDDAIKAYLKENKKDADKAISQCRPIGLSAICSALFIRL